MGFHYGDNIILDGEGKYTARVSVKPMQTRRIGELKGTLTETQTVDIPFEFDLSEPTHRDSGDRDPLRCTPIVPTHRNGYIPESGHRRPRG